MNTFFSQFTFSSTSLLYHKDFVLKAEKILKNKEAKLVHKIHCLKHKINKEIHNNYNIKEAIENCITDTEDTIKNLLINSKN